MRAREKNLLPPRAGIRKHGRNRFFAIYCYHAGSLYVL